MDAEVKVPPLQNDRIMAALAHVTAIMPMLGLIAPIVIWATQKDKSKYVAYQSLQAIVYQLILILGLFCGWAVYAISIIASIPIMAVSPSSSQTPFFIFIPFIVIGAMTLATFLLVVYALAAAIMTLQGRDFRYLVIGNLLQRYLQKN